MAFRFKRSVPVPYDEQGYIFFQSRRYKRLEPAEQQQILDLCMEAGGEHYKALFDFVTEGTGAVAVCAKHYISQSTLERIVRRYYLAFSELL